MFAPHRPIVRRLCWLMAIITPLSPSTQLLAQTATTADASVDMRFVLPSSAGIVSARPNQLLTSEAAQMLPVEVVQAACLKELGFDPLLVEHVVFSMIPPFAGPPSYACRITFSEQIDLSQLAPRLTQHTVGAERGGKSYLKSQDPTLPSLIWADETTLLIASEQALDRLLAGQSDEPDAFAEQLATFAGDDLAVLINLAVLGPFVQLGLNDAKQEIPAEFHEYLVIPGMLSDARIRLNFTGAGPLEISCAARDARAANQVEGLIQQLMSKYRKQANQQAAEMLQSDDPVEQAMGRYIMRVTPTFSEQLMPTRQGERFTIFQTELNDSKNSQLTSVAIAGVLVALLLPAVQAAREAARRNSSINNIKQLMLALLNYEDSKRRFPAYANFDENDKPLLSWRVHILPYLEEEALYKQFNLDEPWNSEHNRKLIPLMPELFVDPSSPKYSSEDGHTHYLGVKGDGLMFNPDGRQFGFASIRDGSSNTIMIVQCNDTVAVPWTKPQDFEPTKDAPLTGLADGFHPGVFLAGFCDGHVQNIANDIDPVMFYKMLTRAGGELVNLR
ncbi:MAG: DUF1559 domain-containing protein [Planctomycetota bacterium]